MKLVKIRFGLDRLIIIILFMLISGMFKKKESDVWLWKRFFSLRDFFIVKYGDIQLCKVNFVKWEKMGIYSVSSVYDDIRNLGIEVFWERLFGIMLIFLGILLLLILLFKINF